MVNHKQCSLESEAEARSAMTVSMPTMSTMAEPAATSEKHLEDFIRISMKTVAGSWVVQLFNICSLVIPCLLLWVREHRVSFTDIFKHLVCMKALLVIT